MPTRVDVLHGVPNDQVEQRVRIIRSDPRVVAVEVQPDGPWTSRITVTMEVSAPRAAASTTAKSLRMASRVDVLRGVPDDEVEERVRIIRRDPRIVAVKVERDGPGTSRITVTMEFTAPRVLAKTSGAAAKPTRSATTKKAATVSPARASTKSSSKPKKASTTAKRTTGRSTPQKGK